MKLETEPCCGGVCVCVCVCVCVLQSGGEKARNHFRQERPDGTTLHEVLAKGNTRRASKWTHVVYFPTQLQVYSITALPTFLPWLSEWINWTFGGHVLIEQLSRTEEEKKERKVLSCTWNGNKCRTIILCRRSRNEGQSFRSAPF